MAFLKPPKNLCNSPRGCSKESKAAIAPILLNGCLQLQWSAENLNTAVRWFREIHSGCQAQLIFESAVAIPQLEGSTSAIAILQLLKKCCSPTAIPQSQFFLESATSSPQLESFISAIFGTFLAAKSGWFMKKKIEGKKSRAIVPLRQVLRFQRNSQF